MSPHRREGFDAGRKNQERWTGCEVWPRMGVPGALETAPHIPGTNQKTKKKKIPLSDLAPPSLPGRGLRKKKKNIGLDPVGKNKNNKKTSTQAHLVPCDPSFYIFGKEDSTECEY